MRTAPVSMIATTLRTPRPITSLPLPTGFEPEFGSAVATAQIARPSKPIEHEPGQLAATYPAKPSARSADKTRSQVRPIFLPNPVPLPRNAAAWDDIDAEKAVPADPGKTCAAQACPID